MPHANTAGKIIRPERSAIMKSIRGIYIADLVRLVLLSRYAPYVISVPIPRLRLKKTCPIAPVRRTAQSLND